ncbi:MAG: serine--tRNA ligase, partial [Actinobacteria bacterium]|nr:serine--tRNA ligase [Actinomycetota bacterium]NIS31215.1 serine--tRNA ligase [Actinomycetota bacterium]NIT95533.1 serine--tRNA ligase [Actinomycetota bacterium]NIU19233.1 serine--tRNA ligase [Actinomycetota bacterium]NIU66352.1 serine--tRNA ligase [Actinomycetota bacterium]
MLDIRLIRDDPEAVKAGIARRGEDPAAIDEVVDLDVRARAIGTERDDIRAEINQLSTQVGALHKEGRGDEAAALQERSRALGEDEKRL